MLSHKIFVSWLSTAVDFPANSPIIIKGLSSKIFGGGTKKWMTITNVNTSWCQNKLLWSKHGFGWKFIREFILNILMLLWTVPWKHKSNNFGVNLKVHKHVVGYILISPFDFGQWFKILYITLCPFGNGDIQVNTFFYSSLISYLWIHCEYPFSRIERSCPCCGRNAFRPRRTR